MQQMIEERKVESIAEAQVAFRETMRYARQAWKSRDLAECDKHLKFAQDLNPHCEVVNRFRAHVCSRSGKLDDALSAASKALADGPHNALNHHAFAIASQRKDMLSEAGTAYLSSIKRGMPGSSEEIGFVGYLQQLRRSRSYYAETRPMHRKTVNGGMGLARSPSGGSIFNPDRVMDTEDVAEEDMEVPDPPQLYFVSAEQNSITVGWYPDTSENAVGITIYSYELEIAQYDVVWEGKSFFDDYRPFERVHRGGPNVLEATVSGLRQENKVMCRVRAQSFSGYSDWNELVVSTLPPPSRQTEALPLPRKWLLVDVADLVTPHVAEVGGDPKRFFLELASCFTPHVRAIRRLFLGWSRTGLVGQKSRPGTLSRQQFMKFCKEVGVCQGGGPMGKRSGAKLLTPNDVDRLFQRANIDTTANEKSRVKGTEGFDQDAISKFADNALDDLQEKGAVEADAGETELREKLKPIFDQYDEDGSGSVSSAEVGKMAASLKMEMTKEQLEQLMEDADPDGSGEIEFEELVAVLKRQIKEGVGGGLADMFKVSNDEGDGGTQLMVLFEFIHALIRLAWECYPADGIGARLNKLLERAVLPGSAHLIDNSDPMEAELSSKHVQAITEYYSDQLYEVFKVFAAADNSLEGQKTAESMSFAELVFCIKCSELIDQNLTVAAITQAFAAVNNQAADDGEKDDDAEELNFAEFKSCICRLANCKIPEKDRGGEPFAYTWQAFLQIIFLPKMKKVCKDLKKGVSDKSFF